MSVTGDRDPRVAVLRSFDAYSHAEARGIGVGFEPLPPDIPSMLLRSQGVVMINSALTEPERHDELAHQLGHWMHPLRAGESPDALEDAVRRDTARRLIPVPALMHAVHTVLAADTAADTAQAAALLLGTHTCTLRDRLFCLSPTEVAIGMDGLLGALSWPLPAGAVHRYYCDPDTIPPLPWWERMRNLIALGRLAAH